MASIYHGIPKGSPKKATAVLAECYKSAVSESYDVATNPSQSHPSSSRLPREVLLSIVNTSSTLAAWKKAENEICCFIVSQVIEKQVEDVRRLRQDRIVVDMLRGHYMRFWGIIDQLLS